MKLHAGHAVVAAMAIFILIMAQFMVRAYHNQESLVAEDYYADELRYQEQIDKLGNAAALGAGVLIEAMPGSLRLTFPDTVRGKAITGELYLMRPSDERGDLRLSLKVDAEGRCTIDTKDLFKGAYRVQIEWQVDGTAYRTEDEVHLP